MAANPSTEPCRYCTATPAELDSQMALVTELAHSRVFLVRDQTHPGRCVVLLKRHARELFELAPMSWPPSWPRSPVWRRWCTG